MRILLIAYEFSPSRSPRALRWDYLTRELALLGHDVQVLAPGLGGASGDASKGVGKVGVHRTFPGPLMGLLARMTGWRNAPTPRGTNPETVLDHRRTASGLNRMGRLADWLKRIVGYWIFPDIRGEWNPWARPALDVLLRRFNPHVVVTSHEPASTLLLGLRAKRLGYRWVADLGDPVFASYTPSRWARRALELEHKVCEQADMLVVTNSGACELLAHRHRLDPARCVVLPQGFDDRRVRSRTKDDFFSPEYLELLYTGRLYAFRQPDALLAALRQVDGVRVTFVLADPTFVFPPMAAAHRGRLRVLGPIAHARVLDLQARADVLLSLGNRGMPAQVPGKLYEYLGARRPILHLQTDADDAAAGILASVGGTRVCPDKVDDIVAMLDGLRKEKAMGWPDVDLDQRRVVNYAMSRLGVRLDDMLRSVVDADPGAEPADKG